MPDGPFAGSGGGLFGPIRHHLVGDININSYVGIDKIAPGRLPKGTQLPYIIMTHISANLDAPISYTDTSDFKLRTFDAWNTIFQVSVYAEGYDQARALGKMVHNRLSRNVVAYEGLCVWIWPNSWTISLDPQLSETGSDVWQAAYRYFVRLPEQVTGQN